MKNLPDNLPFVSIIIPCRNEEKFIGRCLDSILNQDYPKENLEVLVVDGMSEDGAREVVKNYIKNHSFIKLLDNEKKITPVGMNIGIKNSQGNIIIIVNAHSILDKEFIKLSVSYLEKIKEADAVGGKLQTINEKKGLISQTIPLAADSVFGTGGRRYRTNRKEGFIKDTAPYCAYRREVFSKIGYIDEEMIRNQDDEFNLRLLKKGGKIYFTPCIKSYLYIRPSISKLWRQQFQYGYWKVKVSQKVGIAFIQRQIVPAIFSGSLILSLIFFPLFRLARVIFYLIFGGYLLLNLFFSMKISYKKNPRYFFVLPLIFFILHFGYGLGFLGGIIDFMIFKKKNIRNVPLTR